MKFSQVIWRRRVDLLALGATIVAALTIVGLFINSENNPVLILAALAAIALLCFAFVIQAADRRANKMTASLKSKSGKARQNPAGDRSTPQTPSADNGRKNDAARPADPNESVTADTPSDLDTASKMLTAAIEHVADDRAHHAPQASVFDADPFKKADGSPAITVVIPMYNEARFVAATIESLKRQTFADFEAIIVDDASTDNSMAVAMKAVDKDERFRCVRHASNSGLSAARNTGLRLARAPLISFLDSDDMLFPDAFEARINKFKELADVGEPGFNGVFAGVYCRVITMPQSITLDDALNRLKKRNAAGDIVTFVSSSGECPFNAHAPMLLTEVVRRHGGFDEAMLYGCEDWDLWQRILRNGYAFAPTRRLSGVYRRKRGSMVKETPIEHLEAARTLFDRARAPMDHAHLSDNAPFAFEHGVHFYEDQLRFTRRAAQFATINAFASKSAFDRSVDDIPPSSAAYVSVTNDILPFVEAGIRRSIAIDEPSIGKLQNSFDKLVEGISERISTRIIPSEETRTAPRQTFDVLFFPQTQVQVAAMAQSAADLAASGAKILFIHTETETGDQGQRDFLKRHGLDYTSLNRAQLLGFSSKACVVMRPYSAVIRDAVSKRSKIVEIVDPDNIASPPDENMPHKPDIVTSSADAGAQIKNLVANEAPSRLDAGFRGTDKSFVTAAEVIAKEESFYGTPDFEDMVKLKDKWRGERCIIIGNGPSINQTDLTKLKNEFTFAVNGIFYKSEEMGFDPTFYVVEDSSVMKENISAIKEYKASHKLFPTIYRKLHPKDAEVTFFQMNRGFYEKDGPSFCVPRFSTDAARRVYCGQSVTHINLQLAYYFGFQTVYLIGVDFSYVIPESAIRDGDIITSTEDDPNHFHGEYFGKGKTWKDPKLHRVMLNYELARDMFAADGRKVVNATKGGALEVFERANYDDVFR